MPRVALSNGDEIDELEIMKLRQLGGVVNKMMAHPEAKRFAQHAHKLVDPNAATPALDIDRAIAVPVSALEKKIDTFIETTTKRDQDREQNEKINALKDLHSRGIASLRRDSWTDDGIKAVEKLMEEKGLLDPLDAAAIYEKSHPPQTVAAPSGAGGWNFAEVMAAEAGGDAYTEQLLKTKAKNDLVIDKATANILSEFRQQQPARR